MRRRSEAPGCCEALFVSLGAHKQRKNSPAMFMTLLLRVDADLAAATRALPTGAGAGGAGSAARWSLNGGFDVIIVRRPNELDGALKELRTAAVHAGHTMGIDLEWRPDFQPGSNNPAALIQLAAGKVCLLLQTTFLGFPDVLRRFLRDPNYTFVGCNWLSADEAKFQRSFGFGRYDFGHFDDLKDLVARSRFSVPSTGVGALAQSLLGVMLPKDKQVTLSDWSAPDLTPTQIQYAALDALAVHRIHRALANAGLV